MASSTMIEEEVEMRTTRTIVTKKICEWAKNSAAMQSYHDLEWGVPHRDDQALFEFLILEGAQAGLSWATILKKREGYREAFANFDALKISRFRQATIEKLLLNPNIVRNRLKVQSTVLNAKAFLKIQKEEGSFSDYIWSFVDGVTIQNRWKNAKEVPAKTEVSDLMSKNLTKRGFKFVGSTICYAFMQATGLVNDHETSCFRYRQILEKP